MICIFAELAREKCHVYWPEQRHKMRFGSLEIRNEGDVAYDEFDDVNEAEQEDDDDDDYDGDDELMMMMVVMMMMMLMMMIVIVVVMVPTTMAMMIIVHFSLHTH